MTLRVLVSGMACNDPWQGGATWAVCSTSSGFEHSATTSGSWSPSDEELDRATCARFRARSSSKTGRPSSSGIAAYARRPYDGLRPAFRRAPQRLGDADGRRSRGPHPSAHLRRSRSRRSTRSGTRSTGSTCGFDGHTHFVSVGQSIGQAGLSCSDLRRAWITALPPVHLGSWPRAVGTRGRLHHGRSLALVRFDRGRGMQLGHERTRCGCFRAPPPSPASHRGCVRQRPPEISALASCGDTDGPCSTRPGRRHAFPLPPFRAGISRRDLDRQERVRHLALRVVQRPQRVLLASGRPVVALQAQD